MTPPSARWHLCYSPAGPACFSLMPPDTDRLVFFSESDPAAHATCNPSLNAAVGAADTLSLLISYSPARRLPPAVQSSRALARPSHARPLTTNSPLLRRVAARQYCSGGARLAHPAPAHRVPGTCRKLPDLHRVASHSTAQHSIATADSASSSSPSGSFRLAAADLAGLHATIGNLEPSSCQCRYSSTGRVVAREGCSRGVDRLSRHRNSPRARLQATAKPVPSRSRLRA